MQSRSVDEPVSLQALALASLGGDGVTMEPAMRLALDASFGSVDCWRADLKALGQAGDGVARWRLLAFDPHAGHLVNQRVGTEMPAPDRGVPLLALDLQTADSEAGLAGIDWAAVYRRYQDAVHAASEPFGAAHAAVAGALLLDVRRAGVFEQARTMIPGAQWHDPSTVAAWAGELPRDRALIVYCVYGHEVGRATALRLRAAGLNARYLGGGIDGWQAAGRPVVAKPGPKEANS